MMCTHCTCDKTDLLIEMSAAENRGARKRTNSVNWDTDAKEFTKKWYALSTHFILKDLCNI